MSRHLAAALTVLALMTTAAPASARQMATTVERAAATRLSPAERDAALTAIAATIRESYVFPEKRAAIIAALEKARKAGRYDVDDAGVLAERLTEDLRTSSGDHHMYVLYDPAKYAAARRDLAAGGRSGSGAVGANEAAYERQRAIRDHHGLVEQKILPGNIRYLKISQFWWVADETGLVQDEAMRFLKDGDAVIIDLRGNPGGSHPAVRYMISHFMDGDVLEMTFLEGSKPPVQSRTLEHLPAGRLKGKPLYVLIDGNVGSAAEAFAYDVQQFKLGELVGARTGGAANNNEFIPVAPAFMLSVSFGRPVHAVSGTNWDGVGVQPSVEAPPAQALDVAQGLALDRLAKAPGVGPEMLADYDWARTDVAARLKPVILPPGRLEALAGRYGEVEVVLRDGALWMIRSGRPDRRLTPLTAEGLFAVEGSDRLRARFTPDRLETLWRGDPEPRVYPRG